MDPRIFTDDMGNVSGLGLRDPGYEADCRRMVMAGAEWLDAHPEPLIAITRLVVRGFTPEEPVIGNWEDVFAADTPHAHELLAAMHAACCTDRGDQAGPSAMMMEAALDHVRYIASHGWEKYVAKRREIASRQEAG